MADTELGVQMKNENLTEARLRQRWRRGRKKKSAACPKEEDRKKEWVEKSLSTSP